MTPLAGRHPGFPGKHHRKIVTIFKATFLQFSYNFQYSYTKSDRSTYDFWRDTDPTRRYDMSDLRPDYREWDMVFGRLNGHSYEKFINDSLSRFSEYKNYTQIR